MRTVEISTSLGVIPVRGPFSGRFAVLAITGAFAHPSEMSRLPDLLGDEFDGYVARLPGNGTPALAETSVPAFAAAFDEVLQSLGPTVVVGLSVGGLVGLGMRSPLLRRLLLVDPPVATAKLWPLTAQFRTALGGEHDAFVRNVMGVHEDRVEERGYLSLLPGLRCPLRVLVGSEPLMPVREVSRLPSLVDEPEREVLAARGRLTVIMGVGHAVPFQAARSMLTVIRTLAAEAKAAEAGSPHASSSTSQ